VPLIRIRLAPHPQLVLAMKHLAKLLLLRLAYSPQRFVEFTIVRAAALAAPQERGG
jgi:hypothetical protein